MTTSFNSTPTPQNISVFIRSPEGARKLREFVRANDDIMLLQEDIDAVEAMDIEEREPSLLNLPPHLLMELGAFMDVNDIHRLVMTCKAFYKSRERRRSLHSAKSPSRVFQILREKSEDLEEAYMPRFPVFRKRWLQPFQFLLYSPIYGIIQVDYSLVLQVGATPETEHCLENVQNLNDALTCRNFPFPLQESMNARIKIRLNIQKKFKDSGPKVIFRIDESIPKCATFFESKLVHYEWKRGHLTHLIGLCAERMSKVPFKEGLHLERKKDLANCPPVPDADAIMKPYLLRMKEGVVEKIKKGEYKKLKPVYHTPAETQGSHDVHMFRYY